MENELISLVAGLRDDAWFSVIDTQAIGGSYQGEGRPFVLFFEARDPEEIAKLKALLGCEFIAEIGLAAMCNRCEDHRILAEMAVWLADRLSGYIDLAGEVAFPPGLPGQIYSVPYDTACGYQCHYMVMDVKAFRGWMLCPEFEMVK